MSILSFNTSGIYKISSLIDGREYVGSSINIHKRWVSHKNDLLKNRHKNKKIQRFFNKHGIEKLRFSVVEFCEIDQLIEREQFYIDSGLYEFNICKKAGSTLGFKLSEEVKAYLSSIRKGVQTTGMLGKKHLKETKEKIALKAKNRGISDALKMASIAANKGSKHSEKHRLKIANKQRKISSLDVQNILMQLELNVRQIDLAKIYKVSQKVISRVKLGIGIYKEDKDYYEASIKRIKAANAQERLFA